MKPKISDTATWLIACCLVSVASVEGLEYGLNDEAIRAVKKWLYEPATSGGVPVSTEINVTVKFRWRAD
jgi:hypothetical protein